MSRLTEYIGVRTVKSRQDFVTFNQQRSQICATNIAEVALETAKLMFVNKTSLKGY